MAVLEDWIVELRCAQSLVESRKQTQPTTAQISLVPRPFLYGWGEKGEGRNATILHAKKEFKNGCQGLCLHDTM